MGHSHSAEVLINGCELGEPAAFDLTVTSPLTSSIMTEAVTSEGAAALAAEARKHTANDSKCEELDWDCVPMAVETYGPYILPLVQLNSRGHLDEQRWKGSKKIK